MTISDAPPSGPSSAVQREFTSTAFGVLGVQVLAVLASLGSQIAIARWLGVEEYGVFGVISSALALATNVLVLGVPRAHLLLTPSLVARGAWSDLRGWTRFGYELVGATNLVIAAIAGAVVWFGPWDHRLAWGAAAALVPISSVIAVQQAHLQALRRVVGSSLVVGVLRPAATVAAIGAVALVAPVDAGVAVWAVAVTTAAAGAVLAAAIRSATPPDATRVTPSRQDRAWLSTSLQFLGNGVANVVLQQADVVLVGAISGADQAALYAIATRIGRLLLFALGATNSAGAPLIASLHATGDRTQVQALLRRGALGNLVVCLVGGGGLFVAAPWVLWLFGPEFVDATLALRVLLLGYLVNAACGSIGVVVNLTGNQAVSLRILAVAAVATVALDLLVLPRFGILGAAAVSAGVMSAWNLAMVVWCRRELGYDPTILSLLRR